MNAQPNLGMQVTTFENPMGIDGFEFVEFAAPGARGGELHALFKNMGFTAVLKHKSRPITVYRQGGVNFLVNEDPNSFAADFAAKHGPCACGFAIRFKKPAAEVLKTVFGNGGDAIARQGRDEGGECAGRERHRRLHALSDRSLRQCGQHLRRRLCADPRCRPESGRFRSDLHRSPYAQPLLRQHAEVVRLLRAPVQLPRDPLLRHQGRQDRPGVEGDDRAGRHRAHSAQRIERSEDRRSTNTSMRITAKASSTSPASPTTSTTRWRRCAPRAWNSSIRRIRIST